jgi:glycosyltransferase involved in cell wall biosynthesis
MPKTKIYYITRSYYPYQKEGGPMMRSGAVKYLRELGWDVEVIMPNYKSNQFNLDTKAQITQIPLNQIHKIAFFFEKVGFYEDYLDKWVDTAYAYLKNVIKSDDIIISTSGGELGTIKLGSLLKRKINCKFVINFRDPVNNTLVNGLKVNTKFYVSREQVEKKYLSNADLVITSSEYYKRVLQNKYKNIKDYMYNNYFGFIKETDISKFTKTKSKKLRIAYTGSMLSSVQKPEILIDVFNRLKNQDNVEIYFIGKYKNNKALVKIANPNIKFIELLPHNEFLKFMCENIDVGFLSLSKDYYGACVPSKLYEYINLGLPIIGALPCGDAHNIINENKYGISCKYNDINSLVDAVEDFKDKKFINQCVNKVLKDRKIWSMENKILEVDNLLKGLNT